MRTMGWWWLRLMNEAGDDGGDGGGDGGDGGDGSLLPSGDGDKSGEGGEKSGEGGAGDGDGNSLYVKLDSRPDGLADKYFSDEKGINVGALIEHSNHLEKKLGETAGTREYFGAPEGDYELNLPEGVEGEVDRDDPVLKTALEFAKTVNLSQKGVDEWFGNYAKHASQAVAVDRTEEIKKLGDKAGARVEAVDKWVKANLDEDQQQLARQVATTADGVGLLEALIGKSKSPILPTGGEDGGGKVDREALRKMRFEKDDQGRIKYEVDADHRKKVDAAYKEAYPAETRDEAVSFS